MKDTMTHKTLCGAYARSTGNPCRAKALANGRCKNHGGLSTGPKTPESKARIGAATRQRMVSGQAELAKDGFQRWLANGGREVLKRKALRRAWIKQIKVSYI
jgi:hypothetical protein